MKLFRYFLARTQTLLLFFLLFSALTSHAQSTPEFLLKNNTWELITFPGNGQETLEDLVGNSLPTESFGRTWTAYAWQSSSQQYYPMSPQDNYPIQGHSYWIIQITGSDVSLSLPEERADARRESNDACVNDQCIVVGLETLDDRFSWYLVGNPRKRDTPRDILEIATEPLSECYLGCDLNTETASDSLDRAAYYYDSNIGDYKSLYDIEAPEFIPVWRGWWQGVAPIDGDTFNTQLAVIVDEGKETVSLDHVLLVDDGSAINIDRGQVKTVRVVLPADEVSIRSLTVENAPTWITVDDENRLNLAPEKSELGGVEIPFTINYTLSNSGNQTHSDSIELSVLVSQRTVVVSGTMPTTGGQIATEWLDVIFSSAGLLENDYELSFILVEKSPSEYSFILESTPDLSENDIDKITLEHASYDELYLNYKKLDSFSNVFSSISISSRSSESTSNRVNSDSRYPVPSVCSNLPYKESDVEKTQDEYRMSHLWWGTEGAFVGNASNELNPLENGGEPRVLRSYKDTVTKGLDAIYDEISIDIECATALQSTYSSRDLAGFAGREPVLLIHGFDRSGKLGGFDSYFGKLPGMIQELDINEQRYFPLIFRWQTNARYELVADELISALGFIHNSTQKKVHIVAHSFGGLLVRTMLQGIALDSEGEPLSNERLEKLIASVTTIGSPHSGIFGSTVEYNNGLQSWVFNRGIADNVAGVATRFCGSINCHQLGLLYSPLLTNLSTDPDEPLFPDTSTMKQYIGLKDDELGKLVFQLATSYPDSYPDIPTNVLIGEKAVAEDSKPLEILSHDGLITSYGQLWKSQTFRSLLSDIEGKPVTERYLGNKYQTSSEFSPEIYQFDFRHFSWIAEGDTYDGGYVHRSAKFDSINQSEVGFEKCDAEDLPNCRHAGWHYLVNMLESTSAEGPEIEAPDTIQFTGRVEDNTGLLAGYYVAVTDSKGKGESTRTDVNGEFSVVVPFTANAEFTVVVDPSRSTVSTTADRLRAETRTITTFATPEETSGDLGIIRLFEPKVSVGNILLSVNDASNAIALNNFSYSIVGSANFVVASGTTAELFSAEHLLPYDTYRIDVQKEGYISTFGYMCDHNSEQTQCSLSVAPELFEGITVFEDQFTSEDPLLSNWSVVTQQGCCGAGKPAQYSKSNGKLNISLVGESSGYLGVGDGSIFVPKNVLLTSDFYVETSFQELLRTRNRDYKDNSGFALSVVNSRNDSSVFSISVYGNHSGYFNGYNYSEYEGHRIQIFGGSVLLELRELDLNTLYNLKFRIYRVGDMFTVGYQLDSEWIQHSQFIDVSDAIYPQFSVGSGDGGGTLQNGDFSVAVDYLKVLEGL